MYEQATNSEPEERMPPGVRATPTWKWNFKPTVNDVKTFLNTPTPLPQGAVSVSAVSNGFHIFFFE
jgi:hypothetical protein